VRLSPGVLCSEGFLAGSDSRRLDELRGAVADPHAKAIVVARGGYGAMRLLADVPWDRLRDQPKWIVGFSDVTALHAMAWRCSLASIHGPNVTGLGFNASPSVRRSWIAALERPQQTRVWRDLRVVRSGRARGPIVGGNLSLLCSMAAAGLLAIPDEAVLAIEDVNEAPYRVDRMLTSLRMGGYLERVAAVVFGGIDRSLAGPDGWDVDRVIDRFAASLAKPVRAGAPFGHRPFNEAFVLGATAAVGWPAENEVSLSCGEGAEECSA
jgi:muramoyltetrapeptide carboxypeptidase